jgi:hypothetical protein
MTEDIRDKVLRKSENLLGWLDTLQCEEHVPFTEEEKNTILQQEAEGAKQNYDMAIEKFKLKNSGNVPAKIKRFIVYWGYPGAGKSIMSKKIINRFAKDEDCLPFNIIDKDEHRNLFPNLFEHLKGGHIDECEKFAGVTIDYVRQILDLSFEYAQRSVLSIGSMGAGAEFKDNALNAIAHGYKPCAVYMAVNPDVAYLSSVYRSATLYDKIIFQNNELYPRLVSGEYFSRVVKQAPTMIQRIDDFQKEHAENVDLLVVNRDDNVLYDTRRPHIENVLDVIKQEEERPLTEAEITLVDHQIQQIAQNMLYRYENNIYSPCGAEVQMAKTAVENISKRIGDVPQRGDNAFYFGLLGKQAFVR